MGLIQKLTDVATAISNKTGQPASEYTLDTMPTAINSIQTSFPEPIDEAVYAVKFVDYDGTIVSTMTYEQAAALTSLPELPEHEGLTAIGWTSTLEEVKSVTEPNFLDVGAMYAGSSTGGTDTVFKIETRGAEFELDFSQSVDKGVTIDWGDGNTETVEGTGFVSATHTYEGTLNAEYQVKMTPATGCDLILGTDSSSKGAFGQSGTDNVKRYQVVEIDLGQAQLSKYCFRYCEDLEVLALNNVITTIPDSAFQNCYALTSVVIPNSVTSIGSGVFQYCYALTSIVIPNSVTSIGSNAFQNCYALTSVVIPNSVTSIGSGAFQYCYALTSIVIPNSVTSIGSGAFQYCYALASVVIPNSVTSIGSGAFQYCYALTSVVIPNSVTSIGSNAFQSCYALTSVVIPNSVTSIGSGAFQYCYALEVVSFEDRASMPTSTWMESSCKIDTLDFTAFTAVPTLSSTNFLSNLPTYAKIVVPDDLYETWVAASNWSTKASQIVKASEA